MCTDHHPHLSETRDSLDLICETAHVERSMEDKLDEHKLKVSHHANDHKAKLVRWPFLSRFLSILVVQQSKSLQMRLGASEICF